MGQSSSRAARRRAQGDGHATAQRVRRESAFEDAAAPGAEAEIEELNFLLMPGGVLRPDGAVGSPPMKQKTVRVSNVMNAHVAVFQSRHPVDFAPGALALWRVLMREEHANYERAVAASKTTGVPAQPKMGPIYRAFAEELRRMKAEENGDIFDED
ncbi:hypothetical protein ABZS76_32705 [Streptomyces sp. NPDC005562]|uniref:hypothetical protein n=1 Tax=Streptomyces sp. NPDC005562 TaxID=3154890 RepID=UPI0033BD1064